MEITSTTTVANTSLKAITKWRANITVRITPQRPPTSIVSHTTLNTRDQYKFKALKRVRTTLPAASVSFRHHLRHRQVATTGLSLTPRIKPIVNPQLYRSSQTPLGTAQWPSRYFRERSSSDDSNPTSFCESGSKRRVCPVAVATFPRLQSAVE